MTSFLEASLPTGDRDDLPDGGGPSPADAAVGEHHCDGGWLDRDNARPCGVCKPWAVPRPCLQCGTPTIASRCPACAAAVATQRDQRRGTTAARGYGSRWQRLSLKARDLQPFCSDCGTDRDLTTDHSPEAWARHERGLPIRLRDIDVLCRGCNARRGAARGPSAQGGDPQVPPHLTPPLGQEAITLAKSRGAVSAGDVLEDLEVPLPGGLREAEEQEPGDADKSSEQVLYGCDATLVNDRLDKLGGEVLVPCLVIDPGREDGDGFGHVLRLGHGARVP